MEQLKELEQVQNVMRMMNSDGALDSSNNADADSNRFLANFILFMMQPCGELDMNQKRRLISEHFPKISSAFLEEALCQLRDKVNVCNDDSLSYPCDDEKSVKLLQTDCEDMAMVTIDSMQRANSTLEDFVRITYLLPTICRLWCKSYFMFHEMDANSAESIFKYLPLLSFTESYIYQLDTTNEKLVQFPLGGTSDFTFRKLAVLLEGYGIFTDRIRNELKCGEEYWALERKLCGALTRKQEIQLEEVMKAIHLKSFDYRVLNLLLYQLNGKEVNETHMEFLSVSEFLVEVSDDLFDYEDDVLDNNFNILRMFVRIYGASFAPTLLAKSITEAEEKYSYLLSALDPQLSLKYQKRCEEATEEGGKVVGPPLGTWNIPPIIEDEDLYRYEIFNYRQPNPS